MAIADPSVIVGANIRAAREAAGLSQDDLAKRLKCAQSHVARMEKGTRTPSVAYMWKLAEALGVEPAELVDEPRL